MLSLNIILQRPGFKLDIAFEQRTLITGVFGSSGAGKTTLLHIIAGLTKPTRGHVNLGSTVLSSDSPRRHVPAHRRRIGLVFQDARLFPHRSVRANLLYGHPERRSSVAQDDLKRIANVLELTPLLDRATHDLSGGEAQRVAIGRALLAKPRLLLLDEPLANVDHRLRAQIIQLLRRVQAVVGVPMLYVSHELEEILQITDDLLLLEHGRIVRHDSYHTLRHDPVSLGVIRDRGLTNVMEATVTSHDADAGLTNLRLGPADDPADLRAPHRPDLPIGTQVRIGIRPADISLAQQRVSNISIRNQIPATITQLTAYNDHIIVELAGGASMIAEVSPQTVQELQLNPGATTWRLIKSHAVRYLS